MHFYDEINIAVIVIIASRHGAKQSNSLCPEAAGSFENGFAMKSHEFAFRHAFKFNTIIPKFPFQSGVFIPAIDLPMTPSWANEFATTFSVLR